MLLGIEVVRLLDSTYSPSFPFQFDLLYVLKVRGYCRTNLVNESPLVAIRNAQRTHLPSYGIYQASSLYTHNVEAEWSTNYMPWLCENHLRESDLMSFVDIGSLVLTAIDSANVA